MKTPDRQQVIEFLEQSNFIESEYSSEALDDAVIAWDYAIDKPFSIAHLLTIHRLLVKRLNPRIAGRFRTCDVWIGGNRKKFIHESKFKEDIELLFTYMSEIGMVEPDLFAMANHVAFENIHPFEDGNGRVGRILYNVHRLRLGLPIHIIHEGEEQMAYYQWFAKNMSSNI